MVKRRESFDLTFVMDTNSQTCLPAESALCVAVLGCELLSAEEHRN